MRSARTLVVGISSLFVALAGLAMAQDVLIWSDEFDGPTLDPNNWEPMIGDGSDYGIAGWGNNELEYYTARPENLYISNGVLNIVARHESYQGFEYTSARIRSLHRAEFLYGKIEASLQLPTGQGMWPAFWMLPTDSPYGGWAASGEIDIIEAVNNGWTVYGTIHFGGGWPDNTLYGCSYSNGIDYSQGFHTYTLIWEPDRMRWYVDGHNYCIATSDTWYSSAAPSNPRAPFDQYFHLLLNLAVGGNWPGYPDGSAVFPQTLRAEWIRVYEVEAPPDEQEPFYGTPLPIPGRIDAEDFDLGPEGVAYHDCEMTNIGGEYRSDAGVDIEDCNQGGYNVGWLCGGEWIEYTVDVVEPGRYYLALRMASNTTGGECHFTLDGTPATGTLTIPVTGGWQTWTTVWGETTLPAGEHVLRFVNDGGTDEYNINYYALYASVDFDRDLDVDGTDFLIFGTALNGPEVLTPPPGCTAGTFNDADLSRDGDVDLADYTIMQRLAGT